MACVHSTGVLKRVLTISPGVIKGTDKNELLTLGCVSARAILHQNIVERLMMAVRQAVDVHVSNPLVSHHAGGVPAIDDTVIAIPDEHTSKGKSIPWDPVTAAVKCRNSGWASLRLPLLQIYLLLLHVASFSRVPLPLSIRQDWVCSRCHGRRPPDPLYKPLSLSQYSTSVRKEFTFRQTAMRQQAVINMEKGIRTQARQQYTKSVVRRTET